MNECVSYSTDGPVALVHLDRPDRLNAVVPALVEGILAGFEQAGADGARTVILAGRGRAFCAGHDLKEPAPAEDEATARQRLQRIQDVTRAIRSFPGPVIAAVHGYALGAGAEFALGCDLVVAGHDARFGFPEVGVGLSVTGGISALLPTVVGSMRAKELLFLGGHLSAEDAHRLGLVNQVVPAGSHEDAALEVAQQLVAQPPAALALAKSLLDHSIDESAALEREVDAAIATMATGEAQASAAAFRDRSGG
ncbi:MAG: enoyl-CoA hydratase/isomerase family protein [Actinobacteria bacterium]|nr:enoyl-CoA hydratase/isomerase family protein [Actinomycetota bacterium]MCB8997608.1 enoyl-CoA hydratase/isomerase family protein [Actinomycetota bacterium]MCB9414569.1 enoyl-CoA hydratase/isomerase family protein [Actinomycetota bacterium]MCB9423841.1 enoyl-CoA hydratase/isomerase family protein [Actinomycetota bacterium]HRY09152.1 enoyl-CoA hydratase/isomerase family protein [Candidatus Nanopelagicales bacterium]